MKTKTLIYTLLFLAFLVALHQYLNFGYWFELKDIHHETFIVAFTFAALIAYYISKKQR